MKVEHGDVYMGVPYKDIQQGGCFRAFDKVLIKGDYTSSDLEGVISVDLETGTCYDYEEDTMVERLSAKVIIG